jgi:hypothetical protein
VFLFWTDEQPRRRARCRVRTGLQSEAVPEGGDALGIQAGDPHNLAGNLERRGAQTLPLLGEPDLQDPLVIGPARAGHPSLRLEALDERRERRRLHRELVRELPQRARRLLPQGEHHQVLRMRQLERLEHRPVDGHHVARCRHQCEAELILELQKVVGFHIEHPTLANV